MALEKRDATQLVSFEPPQPYRAFPIADYGSTTDADAWGGSGTDGRRYGRFRLDTGVWTSSDNQAQNPVKPGERFQVWETINSGTAFPHYKVIGSYSQTAEQATASPDLLKVYDMTVGTPVTSKSVQLKAGAEFPCTVVGVVAISTNVWDVYFSPFIDGVTIDTTRDGIITIPEPMNGVWLGELGHIQNVTYNWSKPGGPTSLSCLLARPPSYRHPAMNPGRILQAYRGGSCIWEGTTAEPQPDATGWTITANGAGTYGTDYAAYYDSWTTDNPVYEAIGRGLRWSNRGIGKPTGIFLGQAQDSGSLTITDFLNLLCTGGSLYWSIEPPEGAKVPAGPWEVRIREFPTDFSGNPLVAGAKTPEQWVVQEWQRIDLKQSLKRLPPDLYVVNVNPVPRTVTNDYNSLVIKYMFSADKTATSTAKAQAAVYKLVVVDNPASVAAHGRNEYYLDISASGQMTEAAVVSVGQNILVHYVRANFSQSLTIQPGQLLNNGGVPVDLGCDWSGKTCALQVQDNAFGGEVGPGSVTTFMIGDYAFDDSSQTGTITPYQNQRTDLSSIISQLYPGKFT